MSRFALVIAAASAAAASVGRTTASASTAATLAHGPGFVHHQRTAEEILAIAGLNGAVGFFIIAELGESEPARIAGEFVANDLNRIGMKTGAGKPVLQLGLTGLIGKVAYEKFLQGDSFGPISLAGSRIVGARQSCRQDSTRFTVHPKCGTKRRRSQCLSEWARLRGRVVTNVKNIESGIPPAARVAKSDSG